VAKNNRSLEHHRQLHPFPETPEFTAADLEEAARSFLELRPDCLQDVREGAGGAVDNPDYDALRLSLNADQPIDAYIDAIHGDAEPPAAARGGEIGPPLPKPCQCGKFFASTPAHLRHQYTQGPL